MLDYMKVYVLIREVYENAIHEGHLVASPYISEFSIIGVFSSESIAIEKMNEMKKLDSVNSCISYSIYERELN